MAQVMELALGEDGALKTVVEEEVVDDRPNMLGGVGGLDDDVEDRPRHGGVQP